MAAGATLGGLPAFVDTEGAGPGGRQIKEDEAIEDCRIAAVQRRVDRLRRVRHPVGERHLAREHERYGSREQAYEDEEAADKFENSRYAEQREQLRRAVIGGWEAEQLLRAVLHEEKSGDDAQHSEQAWAPVSEVHASPLGVDGA